MTNEEIKIDAIRRHPDCSYAEIFNGLSFTFQRTRSVSLWRNEECFLAGDPPRYQVDGYPRA